MAFAGIAAAAIGAGGSLASGGLSYAYSKKLQRISHDFTERMSNTRYQRTVKDMKLAGINPILAAQSGLGGGGSPSGTAGGSVRQENPGAAAMDAWKKSNEMDQIQASTALAEATKFKNTEEGKVAIESAKREIAATGRETEQAAWYSAQSGVAAAAARKLATEERLLGYTENEARTRSEMEGSTPGKWLTRFEKGARKVLGPLGGVLGGAAGAFIGARARGRRPQANPYDVNGRVIRRRR